MKKAVALLLIFPLLLLGGCDFEKKTSFSSSSPPKKEIIEETDEEMRGIWMSYIELDFSGKSDSEFKKEIDKRMNNIKNFGLNTVIVQARANCDSAYLSDYFSLMKGLSGLNIDPLKYIVDSAHKRSLKIHAWINPYRISAVSEKPDYEADTTVGKWLSTSSEEILHANGGCYLNPSSENVRALIINGVREIIENYDVDGIQIDDYFYPTTDENFDKNSYNKYKENVEIPLSLAEWRRLQVNLLVADLYRTVHKKEGIIFGISPSAGISNDFSDDNYSKYYADIYLWISQNNFADYIAPQIYFGYNYPVKDFTFDTLLKKWCNAKSNKNEELYIGLAAYKLGKEDAGSSEWTDNRDILKKQITDSRKFGTDGFILYSYSYVFSEDEPNKSARKELKSLLE